MEGQRRTNVHVSRITVLVVKIANALVVKTDMENEAEGMIVPVAVLREGGEKTFIFTNKSLQRLICRSMECWFFKENGQIWKVWFYLLWLVLFRRFLYWMLH